MSMKNPLTPAGIEPATFRILAQHLNHCATAVPAIPQIRDTLLVAQLVEALRYKPEGGGFNSRWCHWDFFIDMILPAALWSGVDSPFNRNEY